VQDSDATLLAAWRDGDQRSGTLLFRRHFAAVRRFFRNKVGPDDVEDLVQRTFVGLLEAAPRFRGDSSVRVLVFSIARNQLYKFLRDRGRRLARQVDLGVSSVQALGLSPSSVVAAGQRESIVQEALQRISVDHQLVIELHYWEELPTDDIAAILEIAPTTVRTRLFRARAALDEALQELRASASPTDVDSVIRGLGSRM
jgi:RNA polymerase sigma-70 factor (ECF subfamily)